VIARFESKYSGNTLCMLNTHYDMSIGHEQSSVLVASRIAQYCQSFDTVVMTGDLNTPPNTPAMQYLQGNSYLSSSKTPIPMYETLTAAGAGGATWIGDSFSDRLTDVKFDYIFARRDPQTCVQDGKVIKDLFGGYSSSDHAAIMSKFCIGNACASCK
jgi:endonuclease/exonuclease/phosphatase family metal-dependent hydrolase